MKPSTKIAFLLGTNISRSLSPAFQNAAFQKVGYKAKYALVDVSESEFDSAVGEMLKQKNVVGFNITTPFKERILPYLSEINREASEIGAVNTVKVQGRNLLGFNTDVEGISVSIEKLGFVRPKSRKRALILGAGGAARACIYTLLKHGFESITIMNRTDFHAKAVAKEFGELFPSITINTLPLEARDFASTVGEVDLVVNAISNSARNYFPIRLDFSKAKRDLRLFDLGYKETTLVMRRARERGLRTLGGLLMLVEQGAKSFEIWTGIKAPRKTMMLAAKRALESGNLVRVETNSAVSLVNALATGKGATIGVRIPCKVEACFKESKTKKLEVKSDVPDPHRLVETSVNYALSEIGASIPKDRCIRLRIDSAIPPAVGLKSSSAVSAAVVKAIFELFHSIRDSRSVLDVSCRASKDSGASITGAYDDASASLLGGVVCTDNSRRITVKHYELPKNLGNVVEILVPTQKKFTSSVDKSVYSKLEAESLRAFGHALKGEIAQAMFLNSLVQCSALKYSLEPIIIGLLSGASASGITGKGPAVAAICPNISTARKVEKAWSEKFPNCRIIGTNVVPPSR